MNWKTLIATSAVVTAAVCAGSPPAQAKSSKHKNEALGYSVRVDSNLAIVPPKLTNDTPYRADKWADSRKKFAAVLTPEFEIYWFVKRDNTPVTGNSDAEGGEQAGSAESLIEAARRARQPKSSAEVAERFLKRNEHLFGPYKQPVGELFLEAKKVKCAAGVEVEYVEVNKMKKPVNSRKCYLILGRMELNRSGRLIEVGFRGMCSIQHHKKMSKTFLSMIKSFNELKEATDDGNVAANKKLSDDPEEFRRFVKKNKVPKGWDTVDTKNYLLVYNAEVKRALVQKIGKQIELIREQVYEVMFPADKEVKAVSVVRVCRDKDEYMAYGGSGGSAGYWSSYGKELVFFEDKSTPKDALRVLYHEAFHQYIFYSVGDMAPHSWFNEGHGDYFSGHNLKGSTFKLGKFGWRTGGAAKMKREFLKGRQAAKKGSDDTGRYVPLDEWLTWLQPKYYGNNKKRIAGGENYQLGWSFVYFLRTTKNKDYQRFLPTYFDTLKTKVTAMREWREKKEAELKAKGEEPDMIDVRDVPKELGNPMTWLDDALKAGLEGIDIDKLENDWLNHKP